MDAWCRDDVDEEWEAKWDDNLSRLMTWKPYIFKWRMKLENCHYQMRIVWPRDPSDKGITWRKCNCEHAVNKTHVIVVAEERCQQFSKHLDIRDRDVPLLIHVKQLANTRSLFVHASWWSSMNIRMKGTVRKEKFTDTICSRNPQKILGPDIIRVVGIF